jgi:peptidoglycan/LPS O-acetylase OafA/YrhL
MYLFHIPVIAVIGRAMSGERGLIVVPVEFAVTMVAAAASYRWVESYFLRRSPHLAGAPPHVQRVSQQVAG